MARSAVHVRPAQRSDLPALLAFGQELRDQLLPTTEIGGRVRGVPAEVRALLEQRYVEALDDPERHLVVVVG